MVTSVDIMGVIVLKDVRDKLIIYGGKYVSFILLVIMSRNQLCSPFHIWDTLYKIGHRHKNDVFCENHDILWNSSNFVLFVKIFFFFQMEQSLLSEHLLVMIEHAKLCKYLQTSVLILFFYMNRFAVSISSEHYMWVCSVFRICMQIFNRNNIWSFICEIIKCLNEIIKWNTNSKCGN